MPAFACGRLRGENACPHLLADGCGVKMHACIYLPTAAGRKCMPAFACRQLRGQNAHTHSGFIGSEH